MKYRKLPVEIEAFQYNRDSYVPEWALRAIENGTLFYGEFEGSPGELFVKTLEGDHHVSVGDYIIKGIKDELYPCKPNIFEKTYEAVT